MSVPRRRSHIMPSSYTLPSFPCFVPPSSCRQQQSVCVAAVRGLTERLPLCKAFVRYAFCALNGLFYNTAIFVYISRRFLPSGSPPPGVLRGPGLLARSSSLVTDRSHPRDRLFPRSQLYFGGKSWRSSAIIKTMQRQAIE